MSQPISTCQIVRAANGDEKAYEQLKSAMRYNRTCAAFTQFPCRCKPSCTAPEDKIEAMNERLNRELNAQD